MSQLPSNWVKCQIGEVTTIISGGTPPSKDSTNFTIGDGIPWITPADLSGYKEIYISHGARNLTEKGLHSCSAQLIPAGSVLFSSRAPIGYVAIAKNDVTTNQGFKSFVLPKELESRFIYYYLRYIKPKAEEMATGTTFKELSGSNSAKLPLLIPPLPEQKRIADKLDVLLARVDACRDHLERVPEILKRFRQAVLAAAVSGRLTAEWRRGNNLSSSWKKVHLFDVASTRLGKMLDVEKNTGEYKPYLRNINVRWFGFDLSDIQQIKVTSEESKSLTVCKGDVLVCEGGEPGRCAVWNGENDKYVFQKALHRIRVSNVVSPDWICYCLKVSADSGELEKYFTGTTIKHFTGVSIRKFEFNLPSLDEQLEIICRVGNLFAFIDKIESHFLATRILVDSLTPALLDKAFRGKLVSQNPNDEPASVLLERIREERARQSEQPRQKVKKETKVTKMTEDSIKELIRKLPQDFFSFTELRSNLPNDNYEEIKEILFKLLAESNPCISQVFDPNAQAIRFVRRSQ